MKTYVYKAYDERKHILTGTMDGESRESIAESLKMRGFRPVTIHKKKEKMFHVKPFRDRRRLALFCEEWATLLEAGLPLTETLTLLAVQVKKNERETIENIRDQVMGGRTVADSICHVGGFPSFFHALVHIGEISGTLPEELRRLGAYYEKQGKFREELRMALAYPLFVTFFALVLCVLILTFILPTFATLFESLGIDLPMVMIGALGVGHFLGIYGPMIFFGILLFGLGLFVYGHTEKGRGIQARFLLKSYFVKSLILMRFCFAAAALLQSGKPLSHVLRDAGSVTGNEEATRLFTLVGRDVQQGRDFSESLHRRGLSSPVVTQLVKVGMESGELPRFLGYAGQILTEETERTLRRFRTIMEPAMILFVGSIAAFLIFSVMIPVFTMVGSQLYR